jgi:hypothetical protein
MGRGHPINGRLNIDRLILVVELMDILAKGNSRRKQELTIENRRRTKSEGLGLSPSPVHR